MQTSTFSFPFKAAILAAALAVSGVAQAAAPTDSVAVPAVQSVAQDTPAGKHFKHGLHKQGRGHHARAAMLVPGYGPLGEEVVKSLALNDAQKASLQAAQEAQKELRQGRRAAVKELRQARLDQLKAGTLDPRTAVKQKQANEVQTRAARQELDNKWLAVWDSLDAGQREKIAAHFNARAEKFAQRAQEHKQKHSEKAAAKIAS
jgi:Spy/CpxP family protein refolding chaperone